jgi:hypothetical protein
MQNFGGFLGGALAPIATGFIAQATSFVPALLTAAGIAFVGAMAYLLLVKKPIPEQDTSSIAHPDSRMTDIRRARPRQADL